LGHKHDGTPKADEILDALFALTMACNTGDIRWPEGKRGYDNAMHALRQARDVLRRSNRHGLRMRELEREEPTP
jgi:hypothetical protein